MSLQILHFCDILICVNYWYTLVLTICFTNMIIDTYACVYLNTKSGYCYETENFQMFNINIKSASCNLTFHSYILVKLRGNNSHIYETISCIYQICHGLATPKGLQYRLNKRHSEIQSLVISVLQTLPIPKLTIVFIWLALCGLLLRMQFTQILCATILTKHVI